MLHRQVPVCKNCPYFTFDIQMIVNGTKLNVFDIDLVVEVGKRIRAIAELKKYRNASTYRYIEVPAHEYVGYKKVAKCLRCDLYLIVFDGYFYYVTEIDRFGRMDPVISNGMKVVRFPREVFQVMTESEFQQFWVDNYG